MPRRRIRHKRPHGTGSYHEKDGRHVVQWKDAAGKRRTKSFADKGEALAALAGKVGEVGAAASAPGLLSERGEAWLAARAGKRSAYTDRNRWENHLLPALGHLHPDQVTVAVLKDLLRSLRARGLSNGTLRLVIALLSSLYSDLVEEGDARANPTRALSRKTRIEYLRPDHDPRATPWLRSVNDVLRVYEWLLARSWSVARAYLVGALAGLRTGEVRALGARKDVDFEHQLIYVRRTVERRVGREVLSDDGCTETKSGRERWVPMSLLLRAHLEDWIRVVGEGGVETLLCPAGTRGPSFRGLRFLDEHRMAKLLREALADLGLPEMTWYQATRHTFASQWVAAGGDIRKLSEILGHGSIQVTERHYVHLVPGRFTAEDRALVAA